MHLYTIKNFQYTLLYIYYAFDIKHMMFIYDTTWKNLLSNIMFGVIYLMALIMQLCLNMSKLTS